jgi:6-phospho-beta-glucosidase
METTKIVVLGGSGVATPALAAALAELPGRQCSIDLVLNGRSREKLETVAGIARLLLEGDSLIQITVDTDIEKALTGAQIVLNQIRVGGLSARAFDESFPQEFGLPGEETVGPGGFANASRTIPVVLEYVRRMESICPQATLLTFANPSSLVQYAITRTTKIKTIGLCDGPITLRQNIASAIGAQPEDLVVDYFGMHHFGWVSGVWRDGQDVLPQVMANLDQVTPDLDPAIGRALGVVPGLYHNYFFHPEKMLARKEGKRTRAEELLGLQDELMAEYAVCLANGQKPAGLAKRKARWYRAIIAPIMLALVQGNRGEFIVNLPNRGLVSWLPDEAIVETPTRIDGKRFRPLVPGPLPFAVRVLTQKNCAYEMLAVEAILERNKEKALEALLLNPMIHTYDQAKRTLEEAWSWRNEQEA